MVIIVQNGDKILRGISKEVSISSITKPKIKKILTNRFKVIVLN